jgi:hypothetical protein
MSAVDLNDIEKDIIYEALEVYLEFIENSVLTDTSLEDKDREQFQRTVRIIGYLFTELSYEEE